MKYVPRMPIPWDMVVFLTITTAGFGLSVNKLFNGARLGLPETERKLASTERKLRVPRVADLGCLERSLPRQQHESDVGTIRIRGQLCHLSSRRIRSVEGIVVRNLTNGFEGTVFLRGGDASFVTDFVILEPGRNEIEIQWRDTADHPARRILAEVFDK